MSEPDFSCYDPDELDDNLLDPGIRKVVRWLINNGFHTTDSGDGKYKLECGWTEEDIVPYPHVYMEVEPKDLYIECAVLCRFLKEKGIELVQAWTEEGKPHIECLYDPKGTALIGLFNVTSDMI